MKINIFDIIILHEYFRYPFFLVKMDTRVMVGQLDLDIPVANLAFDLKYHLKYMGADIQRRIVEYLFLH